MKLKYIFSVILCLSLNQLYAQYVPSYIESSTGLANPALDGGRTEIELADINNDGYPDILSIGDHGSPGVNTQEHGIMVWFGDGTGNWSVSMNGDFGYGGIAIGDVNNDGYQDVGYAMHHNYSSNDFGDQLIEVALGDGTGINWIPWDDGLATNGESWGMFGTDFADIDCDGDLDIGSNSFGASSGIHIYYNNGDGSWTQSFGFTGGNSTDDFVFGDVNNDGYPDFAAAQEYGTVYLNDSTGSFIQSDGNLPSAGNMGRFGPDLGDIDNDGTDELSFANLSGGVEIWKWSDGNQWTSMSGNLPASGTYESTQLYDMNSDGYRDLIAFGDGIVKVWLGNGNGGWTDAADISIPNQGTFVALRVEGDADHNGYPDIVVVDEEGNFITYQNHLRFFKENSPADELRINPEYPSPNRILNTGSVQFIKWCSEVPAGNSSNIKIEVSTQDTLGPWTIISDQLKNNGSYQWIVPDSLAAENPCRLRFTLYSGSDSVRSYSPQFFISPQNPVPVELLSFIAVSQEGSVLLRWETGSETNNSGFYIERNCAGDNSWNAVGYIEGKGTTTRVHRYSYLDQNLREMIYNYRLKQIDFNGAFQYSKVITAEINYPQKFSVSQNYPNPFNPDTKISFTIPRSIFVSLIVYDVLGNKIKTLVNEVKPAGNFNAEFKAENMVSGIYFYELTAGDFKVTKKMLLLK